MFIRCGRKDSLKSKICSAVRLGCIMHYSRGKHTSMDHSKKRTSVLTIRTCLNDSDSAELGRGAIFKRRNAMSR